MTGNPYSKAVSAYQTISDENLTPLQIVAELYKGMLKFLREAKTAYEQENYEKMAKLVQRTMDVAESFQLHLDLDNGGKDAKFLSDFYIVLIGRLGKVLDRPDPAHEFDQLIGYVTPVYERWHEFAYGKRDTANLSDLAEGSGEDKPAY